MLFIESHTLIRVESRHRQFTNTNHEKQQHGLQRVLLKLETLAQARGVPSLKQQALA